MPFGYEAAQKAMSSGLQGLTGSISQMLMSDYVRKQEEEVVKGKEQRMWSRKKEEIALVFENNKELAKLDADLRAENDANWRNDPYVKALYKRIESGEATPEEQAVFEGSMEIMESQSTLTPLTEDQLNFLDQIRPQFPTIAIGLYDQELKRAKFAKEIQTDLARINAMYGGREATGARSDRAYRVREHTKVKKTADDISKQIYITKEKLAKEETKVEKWKRKESVIMPKFKGEEKPVKKGEEYLREPETKRGEEPPNIKEIQNLRQRLKDLERKHEVAIQAIEGELETPTGKAPVKTDPVQGILDEIQAGNIPSEITEAMDADDELTFEKAVEEYIRWKLGIKE